MRSVDLSEEYEMAMLLMQRAQVELLTRIAFQTARDLLDDPSRINEIVFAMDDAIGARCPYVTTILTVLRSPS